MRSILGLIIVVLGFGVQHLLYAGGPTQLVQGKALIWDTVKPISYLMDQGPLGTLKAAEAQALVHKAFAIWSTPKTTNIRFNLSGLLDIDVKQSEQYLFFRENENIGNIIIFDNVGDIIDEIRGEGQKYFLRGWAEPPVCNDKNIIRFSCIFNGYFAIDGSFLNTMLHEIGHAIGLDHTQINEGDSNNIPIMYPFYVKEQGTILSLKLDDEAWISKLYPSKIFDQSYGIVEGMLSDENTGLPVLGVNVVAIRSQSAMDIFSCVSGYLKEAQATGKFEIPVMPGNYILRVEPIDKAFKMASSVGPYATNGNDLSFKKIVVARQLSVPRRINAGNRINMGIIKVQVNSR